MTFLKYYCTTAHKKITHWIVPTRKSKNTAA